MRKLLIAFIVLLLLAGAAGAGAIWYIRPSERLDLSYERVPLAERALDMARRLSTEMVLTEADVNNIAKQSIALHPETAGGTVITGARFRLVGEGLVADIDVKFKNRLPARLQITYRLEWKEPVLTAAVERAMLKELTLPNRNFSDVVIPLGDELPKLLHIRSFRIADHHLIVRFRKPTLKELGNLLN